MGRISGDSVVNLVSEASIGYESVRPIELLLTTHLQVVDQEPNREIVLPQQAVTSEFTKSLLEKELWRD